MPTISLCMIVRDEAATLPACLGAAISWVDEIVVVDTGSRDATAAIAAAAGARVFHWAWQDDFAAARNESIRHATSDWILVLDADERLTPEAGPALRAAVGEASAETAGFLVKIVCPREGDRGVVRLNWFPRLFRNLPDVRFEGVIHEQVVGSLAGRGAIERADVEVLHTGYTLPAEQMAAKSVRNFRLLERQLNDDPTYAPGWFQLAETYVVLGRLDEAVDAYRRCLRLLDTSRLTLPAGVIAVALQNLGAALIARGDHGDGVESLEAALAISPDLAPAHIHLGNAALADRRWSDAEAHFARALDASLLDQAEGEYQISPWLMHVLQGCAQARQGKLGEAMASFDAALALEPAHAESLWLLALSAAGAGAWDRCLAALERLGALGRDDFPFHAERAIALGALGRHGEAADAAARALVLGPDSAPVLLLAAESLARAGRPDEAAPAFERLLAVAPESVPGWLGLARCREVAGDGAAMMQAYERAVAIAPESAEVLTALGSACLRGGALEPAEECLAAAVRHAPERLDARLSHTLCLMKRGAVAAARTALDELSERWPEVPQVRQLEALLSRLSVAARSAAPYG